MLKEVENLYNFLKNQLRETKKEFQMKKKYLGKNQK